MLHILFGAMAEKVEKSTDVLSPWWLPFVSLAEGNQSLD
jgi:hypothetical protein